MKDARILDGAAIAIEGGKIAAVGPGDEILRQFPDAEALDCVKEVEHARTIIARGTSAAQQVAIYRKARDEDGATRPEALQQVMTWLAETTAA